MKRIIITLLLAAGTLLSSHATHLMGGQIIAQQISGNDYLITLTTYRDTVGIPMATSAAFHVLDSADSTLFTSYVDYDTSISGQLMPLFPYGVEVYYFFDTITFPGPGLYHVNWINCCRNGAIINMAYPLGESMLLETTVTVYGSSTNSTPEFLAPPVVYLPVNQVWQYNPLPYDPDGDSLVWSIDTPLTYHNAYVDSYVTPSAHASGPFTINSANGQISWTPDMLGHFDASILVDEYRNGVLIGKIRRDMQMIVIPDSNQMARISNMNDVPVDQHGNYYVELLPFKSYKLDLKADDPNVLDDVTLNAYGEPFLLDDHYATFSYSPTGNGNEVNGEFEWTPQLSHARKRPYFVVFRASDGTFSFDETVQFKVLGWSSGIDDQNAARATFNIYPNPVKRTLTVPFALEQAGKIRFTVYDLLGSKVMDVEEQHYPAGNHILMRPTELESGQYFLAVERDGQLISAKKFTVIRE